MTVSISAFIFESLLDSLKPIFTEKCSNEDAAEIVGGIIESYFELLDPNTTVGVSPFF